MKSKTLKLILIVATIIILLFALFIIILKFTWVPDIMVKDTFSATDISVITSELSIEGKIEISKMQYTHASIIYFTVLRSKILSSSEKNPITSSTFRHI